MEKAYANCCYLKQRGVQHFVHFTPVDNLRDIFAEGIKPRNILEQKNKDFMLNDEYRFDGKDHANLSITNPNIKMFYNFRKKYPDRSYAILLIDISILEQYAFSFTATNAANRKAIKCSVEELFSGDRPYYFESNWTTDNQAEVLIKDTIDPKYIRQVQFPTTAKDDLEKMKPIKENNNLRCELKLCDRLFKYDERPLGENDPKAAYEYYLDPWKDDIEDYINAEKAIAESGWTKLFDSIAVHIDDLEPYQENRRSIARWKMRYYQPEEKCERSDNSLSALAVLEKIIHRGRRTILSKELENSIEKEEINKAHQIQSVLIELAKQQKLLPRMSIAFVDEESTTKSFLHMARRAVEDIKVLSENICRMYDCDDFLEGLDTLESIEKADLIVSFADGGEMMPKKTVVITEMNEANLEIDFEFTRVQNSVDIRIEPDILKFLLNYIYRFDEFRENQIDGIARGLRREDSIVLLPTGSGKTVVYQLLSLITPGISFVVSPIISLIDDQIANLYSKGIDRVVGISNMMDREEKDKARIDLSKGQHLMCYVAPERFQDKEFIEKVEYYSRTNIISVIAIDEAHCVSEWGHDFRTAYLGLADTCRRICKTGDAVPPLLALTGTASASVLRDMQHDLDITDDFAIIQPESFDRSEIRYRIYNVKSDSKQSELEEIIKRKIPADFGRQFESFYNADNGEDTNCGIVFCQHVNGSYGLMASEEQLQYGYPGVWDVMNGLLPGKCGMYSGEAPKRWTGQEWNKAKREYAAKFKSNKMPIVVTTKSFGMGIDKPNVRWVVHYGIPSSLEAYSQEVGRTARDKQTAYAYLILSDDFPDLNRKMLNVAETKIENISEMDVKKGKYKGDDISRVLFFHTNTFKGIDKELRRTKEVFRECRKNWDKANNQGRIPFEKLNEKLNEKGKEERKKETEKAIYRLQLMGIFESYTVDHPNKCFVIDAKEPFKREELIQNYMKYIESYQSDAEYLKASHNSLMNAIENIDKNIDFILKVIEHLLREFTYKVIEEGRRRATLTILEAASEASKAQDDDKADEIFRNRLLAYLSTDKDKSVRLSSIINHATDTKKILKILESYWEQGDMELLIGQAARLLEAYPQHYGLHLVRSWGYFLSSQEEKCLDSFRLAIEFGKANYGIDKTHAGEDVVEFLNSVIAKDISAEELNNIVPRLCGILDLDVDSLFEKLTSQQAIACRKINHMHSLVMSIERNKQWK